MNNSYSFILVLTLNMFLRQEAIKNILDHKGEKKKMDKFCAAFIHMMLK